MQRNLKHSNTQVKDFNFYYKYTLSGGASCFATHLRFSNVFPFVSILLRLISTLFMTQVTDCCMNCKQNYEVKSLFCFVFYWKKFSISNVLSVLLFMSLLLSLEQSIDEHVSETCFQSSIDGKLHIIKTTLLILPSQQK